MVSATILKELMDIVLGGQAEWSEKINDPMNDFTQNVVETIINDEGVEEKVQKLSYNNLYYETIR